MDQVWAYLQEPYVIMALNGLVAGWLAGQLLGGGGLIRNLIVGIIGAFIGGALIQAGLLKLPFTTGFPIGDQIVVSTIGAIIVVLLARIIAR
ncbi:MAG: GlsB/YeaQ/YmgE family stress response membrane protein [Hyphomicrobium sp.]|nr:GlsB/YeaQ/YmgE family stress response membrane protein [Hyphomicrobium sp.]